MRKIKQVFGFRLQATVILAFFVLAIAYSLQPTTSLAQQATLAVSYSPAKADLKTNDEKIVKFTFSSDRQISAFDLNFNTSGSLKIINFEDNLAFDNKFSPFNLKKLAENISPNSSRIAYIFNSQTADLPKSVSLYIRVSGTTTGEGKITLDYNNSQVLNGSGSLIQIDPNQSASYNLNLTSSSPEFIDPTTLPPLDYPASTAVINLKVRLYGAIENPQISNIKGTVVAVSSESKNSLQPIDLTVNKDGTFSGKTAFPDFKDGTKYSLMVKVDKYLLRRICDNLITEQKLTGYECATPALTIKKGENTFDFSGTPLIPGDLGQLDGILNGYDLAIVRNNFNKNTPEAVALADLNYDGTVDQKDYEIISYTAGNTSRKADK